MAKGRPVGVDSPGGGDTVVSSPATGTPAATCATCCLNRSGTRDMPARSGSFKRMFQQFARSRAWFATLESARYDPANVTWEEYYYRAAYAFKLDYQVRSATAGPANGTISITLRVKPTVHTANPGLQAQYPTMFSPVTEQRIRDSVAGWDAAIQRHWTNRYTVQVGAPDCPGDFPIQFSLVRVSSGEHVAFTVLDLKDPRDVPALAQAMRDPDHDLYESARDLFQEWRSNAGKFNIGDSRGNLVFAHEFGHWMGWGDEYIQVSGSTPEGYPFDDKNVLGQRHPLRVAIKIKNPTKRYQDAHGSTTEIVDITTREVVQNLMASMTVPTYSNRCVYTIVDDFITLYNQNHYNGRPTAYCIDVLVRR